jgi:LacI family transcriptional regulator
MARTRKRVTPTIVEVAEAAGVSIKTVSRILNNEGTVREETAARVRRAADKLGYTVNLSAQRLARGRSGNIGMLLISRSNWIRTAQLVAGAVERAQERGYGLVPYVIGQYVDEQRDFVLSLRARKAVDGLLLTVPWSETPTLLGDLKERSFPHVRIAGPPMAGHPQARSDDRAGAHALTRHLIDLGHRRISVVGGQAFLNVTRERLAGFRQAMEEAGLDPDASPHHFDNYLFATGFKGAASLLSHDPPPTALFCLTDAIAAGALRQAHEMGRRIPADVSICGMGDSSIAEMVWPPLTTALIPSAAIAADAVDMLIELIEGRDAPADIRHETPVRVRESTGPAPMAGAVSISAAKRPRG